MSVNIRNPLTGQLTNASGGVINPKSINEMIAPIEDGTASKAYAVGEQFIMNDLLCEATQAIAQGDTMVIGTNCEESEQLSKQVKDIKSDLTDNGEKFKFGYDSVNDEMGYYKKVGGADTFIPFSSRELTLKAKGVVVSSDAPINITIDKNCKGKLVLVLTNDYNYQTYSLSGDALVNQSTEYTLGWALRTGSTNSNMLVIDLELQSGTLTIQFSRPQSNSASFYALITS